MVVAIFGESGTGKSTLAEDLKNKLSAKVNTGKDCLRLAGNEKMAKKLFRRQLTEAVSGEHIIYVISEKENLSFIPAGAIRVLLTADLALIREQFAERMHGNMPASVALMLERKHGMVDAEPCDVPLVAGEYDKEAAGWQIQSLVSLKSCLI